MQTNSTATNGLVIQSLISRTPDRNEYALMACTDLSAVLDLVNIEPLLKSLPLFGFPAML
jgi:hypothetical protein